MERKQKSSSRRCCVCNKRIAKKRGYFGYREDQDYQSTPACCSPECVAAALLEFDKQKKNVIPGQLSLDFGAIE